MRLAVFQIGTLRLQGAAPLYCSTVMRQSNQVSASEAWSGFGHARSSSATQSVRRGNHSTTTSVSFAVEVPAFQSCGPPGVTVLRLPTSTSACGAKTLVPGYWLGE